MRYILIKIFQITLVLFVSFTLHIIPWIPSLLVEDIVNYSIIGLFIFAGYLIYLIIKKLYNADKKINIYKATLYTLLLFAYVGLFAIAQIGSSIGESKYLQTYTFDGVTFYTYKTIEGGTEVSKKDDLLPIRSVPIASFPYGQITLNKEGMYLYAIGENIHTKVYDFKNKIAIKTIDKKG